MYILDGTVQSDHKKVIFVKRYRKAHPQSKSCGVCSHLIFYLSHYSAPCKIIRKNKDLVGGKSNTKYLSQLKSKVKHTNKLTTMSQAAISIDKLSIYTAKQTIIPETSVELIQPFCLTGKWPSTTCPNQGSLVSMIWKHRQGSDFCQSYDEWSW